MKRLLGFAVIAALLSAQGALGEDAANTPRSWMSRDADAATRNPPPSHQIWNGLPQREKTAFIAGYLAGYCDGGSDLYMQYLEADEPGGDMWGMRSGYSAAIKKCDASDAVIERMVQLMDRAYADEYLKDIPFFYMLNYLFRVHALPDDAVTRLLDQFSDSVEGLRNRLDPPEADAQRAEEP